ncbi:MAG: endonuclease/exonuclease/phosphatase family protein [Hymenobacteraceae bacterium]|nr:endonuclease/exonuclease/phosphatase family protein [Hymenobacteraceae bacterium]
MRYGIKTIFLFFTFITLTGCARLPFASEKRRPQTIAFYSVERLHDTQNDPSINDEAFTPEGDNQWTEERYQTKINNLATVIAGIGESTGPAIIGLSEVENEQVLRDLLAASPLRKAKYSIIHYDMPDERGLDVALLYKPSIFSPTAQQAIPIPFNDKNFKSRDILQVQGELLGEPVTIYVNHWPPASRTRRGRQDDSNVRAAAAALRQQVEAQQKENKNAKIIAMGDFGVEPNAEAMQQVLQATGRPNPYYDEELFNTFYIHFVNGRGSYHSQGNLQMLDQILISKSLIDGNEGLQYVRGSAKIHDPEQIKFLFGKYKDTPRPTFSGSTYFGGYSDHYPVYIKVERKRQPAL